MLIAISFSFLLIFIERPTWLGVGLYFWKIFKGRNLQRNVFPSLSNR